MSQATATAMAFFRMLKENRDKMTKQQFKTLKGQCFSGDVESAYRGFAKIMQRREKNHG